jgi:hypothetical protein
MGGEGRHSFGMTRLHLHFLLGRERWEIWKDILLV